MGKNEADDQFAEKRVSVQEAITQYQEYVTGGRHDIRTLLDAFIQFEQATAKVKLKPWANEEYRVGSKIRDATYLPGDNGKQARVLLAEWDTKYHSKFQGIISDYPDLEIELSGMLTDIKKLLERKASNLARE